MKILFVKGLESAKFSEPPPLFFITFQRLICKIKKPVLQLFISFINNLRHTRQSLLIGNFHIFIGFLFYMPKFSVLFGPNMSDLLCSYKFLIIMISSLVQTKDFMYIGTSSVLQLQRQILWKAKTRLFCLFIWFL